MSGLLDKLIAKQREMNEEYVEEEKGVNPPDTETEEKGNVCPTCGKFFLRLSMHKCKSSVPIEKRSENAQLKNTKEPLSENEPESKQTKELHSLNANFNLYINVFIQKGKSNKKVFLLDDLLEPITKNICEQSYVDHWSFVEYGAGKGKLASSLERMLRLEKYQNIDIFCYTDSAEWLSVSHVLRKNATIVFTGK